MKVSEAIEEMFEAGKITKNERLRIFSLRTEELRIAAISAITEREFNAEIKNLKEMMMDLRIFIAKDKIKREVSAGIENIFGSMLKHMK